MSQDFRIMEIEFPSPCQLIMTAVVGNMELNVTELLKTPVFVATLDVNPGNSSAFLLILNSGSANSTLR